MFFNDDDDQDFISSGGGSKLANLFGMDKASRQGGNESLTYTAPKQPKKKESANEVSAPSVILASVVHAYKYIEGKYASQGKLGAALLANHAAKDYRILLYVNQQKQVTNAKITSSFVFNIQQNNYASFYDDARQTWSIMFESAESAEKFAKEVAIAKANSVPGVLTELIQQELLLGEGGPLESGDSAEVKYIGWLLTNGALGKIFDQSQQDNYFRFRVGKGKVIKGWDQGMLGMKKGAKKLLIIPPSLAYGSQGSGERIPPDATLVFEVQVMRVKLQKGESPQPSPAATPGPTPVPAMTQDNDDLDDPGVKGRTRSINEHITQAPDSSKAKLISRMARMGQQMLPLQGAVAAQPEDSDEEMQHTHMEPHTVSVASPVKPNLPAKPRSMSGLGVGMMPPAGHMVINPNNHPSVMQPVMGNPGMLHQPQPDFLQSLPGAQQLALYQNPNSYLQQQQAAILQQQQLLQQQQQMLGQGFLGTVQGQGGAFGANSSMPQPAPQHTHSQPSAQPPDTLAPALLSETRQQNTEVRIGLSKVSDKVDKILEKIDHLNTSMMGQNFQMLGSMTPFGSSLPAPSMEANVLMQNITRIVQENERLKKELYEQSHKVHEQNEKIAKLLEQNQRSVEQSHSMLEQRNEGYKTTATQSQARVLALEQEKIQLATELSSASAQISTLQLELGEYRKREGELKQQIQLSTNLNLNSKDELEKLRLLREENEQKISEMTSSLREEKQTRKAAETKLASLNEELNDLRTSNVALEKNLTERKRRAAEEKRKLEEDIEESKANYEQIIETLREKLRKQKTSVDAEADFKVSKIEEDLTRELQAKYERNLAVVMEKHSRQVEDLKSEKDELLRKIDELEKKVVSVRASGTSTEKQVLQLQDELADMRVWKDKYDVLRNQASAMKDKYEKRLEEMEGEMEQEEEKRNEIVEKAKEQRQDLLQQIQQLQQQLQQLRKQLQTTAESAQQRSAAPSSDVTAEVKKIMNTVFQTLRAEFDSEESYSGADVLAIILNVIKETTLKLVKESSTEQEESEQEEEEEEESSEDEDKNEKKAELKKDEGVDEVDDEEEKEEPASAVKTLQTSTELRESSPSNLSENNSSNFAAKLEADKDEKINAEITREDPALTDTHALPDLTEESLTVNEVSDQKISEENNDIPAMEAPPQNDEDNDDNFEEALDEIPVTAEEADVSAKVDDVQMTSPVQPAVQDMTPTSAILSASTVVAPKVRTDVIDQPPPLFDDDDDEDSPLFGDDSTVSDTLGGGFSTKPRSASTKKEMSDTEATPANTQHSMNTPKKKLDQSNEEDSKPQPPPPLFGDDTDEDDLDWLS